MPATITRTVCGVELAKGDVIELKTLRRLWKDGVPASVRKKPNHRPHKTEEWTRGWEWVELVGRVEKIDGDYMCVEMWSVKKNKFAGRFTNVNLDKIGNVRKIG